MSFDSEKAATREAFNVKRSLKTDGWTIQVHENMGWHFSLRNLDGHLSLHQSRHTAGQPQYWTLFSITGKGVGDPALCDNHHSIDPNKAVAHQMNIVERHFVLMKKLHEQFNQLKAQLK